MTNIRIHRRDLLRTAQQRSSRLGHGLAVGLMEQSRVVVQQHPAEGAADIVHGIVVEITGQREG
jgi:hypothetical protein